MGKQLWRDMSALSRGGRAWRGGTEAAISNPCSGWDSEWIWKVSRNSISNPWTCPVLSRRTHTRFHLTPPEESRHPVKLLQRRMQAQRKQGMKQLKAVSASPISLIQDFLWELGSFNLWEHERRQLFYYTHGLFPLRAYYVPPRHSFQSFIKCWCYCPHISDKGTDVQKGRVASPQRIRAVSCLNLFKYQTAMWGGFCYSFHCQAYYFSSPFPTPQCLFLLWRRGYTSYSLKPDSAMRKVSGVTGITVN